MAAASPVMFQTAGSVEEALREDSFSVFEVEGSFTSTAVPLSKTAANCDFWNRQELRDPRVPERDTARYGWAVTGESSALGLVCRRLGGLKFSSFQRHVTRLPPTTTNEKR